MWYGIAALALTALVLWWMYLDERVKVSDLQDENEKLRRQIVGMTGALAAIATAVEDIPDPHDAVDFLDQWRQDCVQPVDWPDYHKRLSHLDG